MFFCWLFYLCGVKPQKGLNILVVMLSLAFVVIVIHDNTPIDRLTLMLFLIRMEQLTFIVNTTSSCAGLPILINFMRKLFYELFSVFLDEICFILDLQFFCLLHFVFSEVISKIVYSSLSSLFFLVALMRWLRIEGNCMSI